MSTNTMCLKYIDDNGDLVGIGDCSFSDTSSIGSNKYEIETRGDTLLLDTLTHNANKISDKINDVVNKTDSVANALNAQTLQQVALNGIQEAVKNELAKHNIHFEKTADYHDFLNNGDENITDTNGDKIIPKHALAKNNGEQAIENARANKIDHGKILDGVGSEIDDLYTTNLIEKVLNYHRGDTNE